MEILINRDGSKPFNREAADYQCFYSFRRGIIYFSANYKVKLTNTFKEVKQDSKLWFKLFNKCTKLY